MLSGLSCSIVAKKLSQDALAFFREQGSEGGRKGAKARMAKLTPEQRSEIARKAGKAGGRGRKKVD
jgi:hypothetical protein